MADSKRQQILANVVSTLEGITVLGGYNTDVGLVSEDLLAWDDVPADKFPALHALPDVEDPEPHTFNSYRNQFEIVIGALVNASENRTRAKELLLRDIKKIILVDRTRGGHSHATRLGQVRMVHGLEAPYNFFEISIIVEYDHDMDSP